MFQGLMIPEREGQLALRAHPDMPENQRARLLASAAVSGPGVKLDGSQGDSWPTDGQPVPEQFPADPSNASFLKHNHAWAPHPTGGWGSWSFAWPMITGGPGQKLPVGHTLNQGNWQFQEHAPDNRYDPVQVGNPEYADRLTYDHLGITVMSTGHDEFNHVNVLSSLMIADYAFPVREAHSNYWYEVTQGQYLSKEVRAKTSSAFRIFRWNRCLAEAQAAGASANIGNGVLHPDGTFVPSEGEDIPPSEGSGPITGPDGNVGVKAYAIARQMGDGQSNWPETNKGTTWDELIGGRGFSFYGDMNFRGPNPIPIGRPNNVAFWDFGPPHWNPKESHGPGGQGITPFLANDSFLASGPLMFSARKHRQAFKEGEFDLRSAAISTRAYYWNGKDENATTPGHYLSGNQAINPFTGETLEVAEVKAGPIAFEEYDWPWPRETGFWHKCVFYFNPWEDHHAACAPGGVLKQGGQWHVIARVDLTSVDDPAGSPPEIGDDPPGWGPITGDKKVIVDGKLQIDGAYIQPRANSHRPSTLTRERSPTNIPVDKEQAHWMQHGDLDHGFGDQTIDRLAQPMVMAELSGHTGVYTRQPRFDLEEQGEGFLLKDYKAGTGPGFKIFAPPEVQDYQVWDEAPYPLPDDLSAAKVVLLNVDDGADTSLWAGLPRQDGKVENGLGLNRDSIAGDLGFDRTDDSGDVVYDRPFRTGLVNLPMTSPPADEFVLVYDLDGSTRYEELPTGGGGPIVGEIREFGIATLPTGWLECDGSACPEVELKQVLIDEGYLWGGADGAPLLPNFVDYSTEGRTPEDESNIIGSTRGAATHGITSGQLPEHNHGLANHVHDLNNHTHAIGVTNSEEGGHTHTDNGEHVAARVAEQEAAGEVTSGAASGNTGAASGNTASTGDGEAIPIVGPRKRVLKAIYGGAATS